MTMILTKNSNMFFHALEHLAESFLQIYAMRETNSAFYLRHHCFYINKKDVFDLHPFFTFPGGFATSYQIVY